MEPNGDGGVMGEIASEGNDGLKTDCFATLAMTEAGVTYGRLLRFARNDGGAMTGRWCCGGNVIASHGRST